MPTILEQMQTLLRPGGHRRQRVGPEDALRRGAGQPAASAAGETAGVLHPTVMMIMMDSAISRTLAQAFRDTGYEVYTVQDVSDAVRHLSAEQPSCIVLCSPAGPHACKILRRSTPAPILALLPRLEEAEMLATLDAGADDCQMASIGIDETILRTRALLRRTRQRTL